MGFAIWLCVLCLQASSLSHALDADGGAAGVGRTAADEQNGHDRQQRALPLGDGLVFFRRKRQVDPRSPAHLSHSGLPGAVSVKGFPNTLIQADRSRRHLVQAASKKKNKRKSRVGSYSLLSNDKMSTPLQVIRARRQVKSEPSKHGKTGRSGAFSVLGDPQSDGQSDRPRRSIQRAKTDK